MVGELVVFYIIIILPLLSRCPRQKEDRCSSDSGHLLSSFNLSVSSTHLHLRSGVLPSCLLFTFSSLDIFVLNEIRHLPSQSQSQSSTPRFSTPHTTKLPAMSAEKELTFKELSEHNTKKDLYVAIHDKVYDVSSFIDEHPYVLSFPSFQFMPIAPASLLSLSAPLILHSLFTRSLWPIAANSSRRRKLDSHLVQLSVSGMVKLTSHSHIPEAVRKSY